MASSTSTVPPSLPDISGYAIVERLYLGSRTAVYRAMHRAGQRSVVIKVLQREYPSFSELVQFRNQYAIAKTLPIPGIVQPLSLEPFGNGHALVMEDCGGISLRHFFKGQALPVEQVLAIALQLADILHDLHQHRVIHKDIKPANILIHPESRQVKLIDFSIASLLPKETQEIQNPNTLEGTLAYLAPEQTGRMNRGVDYRADYYGLGITLYEMLTGHLPFTASDPLELMHCHIARLAPPVHQVNPSVPQMVGLLVARLMAKNAEDRYQSALGLKHDLAQCLSQWNATGTIAEFDLGQRDLSDRFNIPEKLYGRDAEVQALLDAFDRVAAGTSEMMLVAGFSGIGKTAVVNEVHKPIVKQRGYFIKGKFDQFNRTLPLSAFVHALRDLMVQLLSESDEQLAQWKTQLLTVLGENGQVLIEVIPELEQLIGPQPPAPDLSGNAAQNRFNRLFQKFIEVFTTVEHPLVLFLDDLQWADSDSLQLIKLLMHDSGYLLMLGAYRNNEVSPAHPLTLMVEDVRAAQAIVNTITLAPLAFGDTNHLVAETLNCSIDLAQPLTELIDRKTQGNPFFATQFLKALHEEGQITFNYPQGYWECDIAQVNARSLTDDVVEFMAQQLQKLPDATQQALKLSACMGNQFDLKTLAIVSETSTAAVADALWSALREGLILPQSEVYKFYLNQDSAEAKVCQLTTDPTETAAYRFLHDRVQQAAYSLIPETQKQIAHFNIGMLLLHHSTALEQEERLFEIVSHLNIGRSFIVQPAEQAELVQFNLRAARKAKAATAYGTAVDYLTVGIELLPPESWCQDYDLTLALHEEMAEALYLNTDFEQMEHWSGLVLHQARTLLDTIKVQQIRIMATKSQGQLQESLTLGLQVLKSLGVDFPEQPTEADVGQALGSTAQLWQGQSPLSLLDLPAMGDPYRLAAMDIMTVLIPSAYRAIPILLPLLICKQVEFSIQSGNCPISTFAYADYGLLLSGVVHDLESGYAFGQLALAVMQRFQATACKCRAGYIVNYFINHWQEPLQTLLKPLLEAYQSGLETGDLESVALNAHGYCYYSYFAGKDLTHLAAEMESYRQAIRPLKQVASLRYLEIAQQTVLNLLGVTEQPWQLTGSVYSAEQFLSQEATCCDRNEGFHYFLNQTFLLYLFGRYEQAAQQSRLLESSLDAGLAQFPLTLFAFYDALIQLAQYRQATAEEQPHLLDRVQQQQNKLQYWATLAPFNHQHRCYLVAAERCRVLGQRADALDAYDQAIALAEAQGYVQDAALGNELAAQFYLDWDKEKIAADYMQKAYYGYSCWGAEAKVRDLEHHYPNLLAPILQQQHMALSTTETLFAASTTSQTSGPQSSSSGSSSVTATLDLATVLKASQALSGEIQLDKLLAKLLHTVLENAGADKGALLMLHEGQWFVEAVATVEQGARVEPIPLAKSVEVPQALIHSVKRSLQPVVIVDALAHATLALEPYILRQQPKSLLCTPILQQGKLAAILYLENQVTAGAFTHDRVELLNLLCVQAAISLENAHVYQKLKDSQQLLQLVFDTLPQRVFWKDLESRYLGCNRAFLQDAALTELDQILGKTDFELIWRECAELFRADDAAVMESGIAKVNFEEPQHKEGTTLWLRTSKLPLRNAEGEIIGVFGSYEDITPLKQAETLLRQQKHDLEIALQQLQNTQLQMVQSEKMATLGNLVAGVAHEINNPVGFLNGSISNAKDSIQDLLGHLALYQQHCPEAPYPLQDHAEAIDLDFLVEDLPKLLESMKGATDRIKGISISLRTFSRADTEYKVSANLHDGLNSTLLILKYRLKANGNRPAIAIQQNYGELPTVDCFPGQLNQVFMNILANAIDMFDEMAQQDSLAELQANPPQITLQTDAMPEQNAVEIRIRDNGKGMTEAVTARIFDHLFTTKGVGKGTGLGLAIARQIVVETHSGSLQVASGEGLGTEFLIRLPIRG